MKNSPPPQKKGKRREKKKKKRKEWILGGGGRGGKNINIHTNIHPRDHIGHIHPRRYKINYCNCLESFNFVSGTAALNRSRQTLRRGNWSWRHGPQLRRLRYPPILLQRCGRYRGPSASPTNTRRRGGGRGGGLRQRLQLQQAQLQAYQRVR